MNKIIYHPFKPPFKYNMDGQWIEDSEGNRLLDLRGWGYLTGKGTGGLKMDEQEAANIQDSIGKYVAHLMNAPQIFELQNRLNITDRFLRLSQSIHKPDCRSHIMGNNQYCSCGLTKDLEEAALNYYNLEKL